MYVASAKHTERPGSLPESLKLEIFDTIVEGDKVWARVSIRKSTLYTGYTDECGNQGKATATLSNGEPYIHEVVYMLETTKDSDGIHKVSKISEMVDPLAVQKVLNILRAKK